MPVTVARTDELDPGEGLAVDVGGLPIAVFNVDGRYYAVDNACTHAGGSLGNGAVEGTTVTCPLHGAEFDVTTGEALRPPARDPVATYEVTVEDGEIRVAIEG